MKPPLVEIRQQLARLGRARRRRRWLSGLSVLVSFIFGILAALLALDVLFELDVLQRITVSLIGSAALMAVVHRRVRPYFGLRETEVDLALLVERLNAMDTDLVAAIEFTRPAAAAWGSAALREAVIRHMEDRGSKLDMSRAVDRRTPRRRLCLLALTSAAFACAGVLFPDHFSVFWRRLALSNEHYPSQTQIRQMEVNHQLVLGEGDDATPRGARCAERAPVEFLIRCQRRPPATGELLIRDSDSGSPQRVPLERQEAADSAAAAEGDVLFVGQLPALLGPLQYQVFLGDAWTNPARVEMIPLPQVEVRLAVEPPAYSRSQQTEIPAPGAYRVTVLQGSSVQLTLRCVNGKRLRRVWADVYTSTGNRRHELKARDEEATNWQLNSAVCEPLRNVAESVRFDLSVVDDDGLQPLRLPSGEIRVRADQPPDALTATIHHAVLPSARPTVAYRVTDDFGISRLRIQLQIQRQRDRGEDAVDTETPPESHFLELDGVPYPLRETQLPYAGRYLLDLLPWQLHQGDRLKVTLETTDYRGATAGASVMSKPLYLEVSDEAGVLAAILAADQRAEQDLDEMIQRQVGLGEAP